MSAALVRESLDIFGYTDQDKKTNSKKKKYICTSSVAKGVKKNIESTYAIKHKNLTVYKAKTLLEVDNDTTNKNVMHLLKSDVNTKYQENTEKILKNIAAKKCMLNNEKQKQKKKEDNKVLTDEDMKFILNKYDEIN